MTTLDDLKKILGRMRYVRFGDILLSDDHNTLVDYAYAVYDYLRGLEERVAAAKAGAVGWLPLVYGGRFTPAKVMSCILKIMPGDVAATIDPNGPVVDVGVGMENYVLWQVAWGRLQALFDRDNFRSIAEFLASKAKESNSARGLAMHSYSYSVGRGKYLTLVAVLGEPSVHVELAKILEDVVANTIGSATFRNWSFITMNAMDVVEAGGVAADPPAAAVPPPPTEQYAQARIIARLERQGDTPVLGLKDEVTGEKFTVTLPSDKQVAITLTPFIRGETRYRVCVFDEDCNTLLDYERDMEITSYGSSGSGIGVYAMYIEIALTTNGWQTKYSITPIDYVTHISYTGGFTGLESIEYAYQDPR